MRSVRAGHHPHGSRSGLPLLLRVGIGMRVRVGIVTRVGGARGRSLLSSLAGEPGKVRVPRVLRLSLLLLTLLLLLRLLLALEASELRIPARLRTRSGIPP